MDEALRQLIEEALAGEPHWTDVASRLRPHLTEHPDDAIAALVAALDYGLTLPFQEERREVWGPFVPFYAGPEGIYPPPLPQVDEDTLAMWADVCDAVDDPLLQARLADLLWMRRMHPRPDLRARQAVDAYLTLADRPSWRDILSAIALMRALELATSLNDAQLVQRVVDRIVVEVRDSMCRQPPQSGVFLRLISALAQLRSGIGPAVVDTLLEEAARVCAEDPFNYETVLNLQIAHSRGDPEQTAALALERVRSWRALADRSTGLLRLLHLQRALEVARVQGLRHEMDELRVSLEQATAEGLDLKTISTTIEIPGDELDPFLDSFLIGETWQDCLMRFGAHCPIRPTTGQTARFIDEQMQRTPIQFLVSSVVLSEDHGIPLKVLRTVEEKREFAIMEYESRSIQVWGMFAADILGRIADRSRPSLDELTEHFTTPIIDAGTAERIAASIDHYWSGRYDEALFVLLPRLETIIRELCRQLGRVIIKEPIGEESGGFLTLGTLLPSLRGSIHSEDHCLYLHRLLVDTLSINLRNRGLHGLIVRGDQRTAALAVHAACFLALLRVTPVSPEAPGR